MKEARREGGERGGGQGREGREEANHVVVTLLPQRVEVELSQPVGEGLQRAKSLSVAEGGGERERESERERGRAEGSLVHNFK